MNNVSDKYLALSGGIGGAKLAFGLNCCLEKSQLTIVANTGDDFEHLGLLISPDIDTLLYTLAGMNNSQLGWGRKDESWNFSEACEQFGLDTWFKLGDRDLAIHFYRSQRIKLGASLSQVVSELCDRLKIQATIIPMSDDPVRTVIKTDKGTLSFQEYFVKNRCLPIVSNIHFEGKESARPSTALVDCLNDEDLKAIIICPSNPFLSVQPILSIPSLREKIKASGKPVIVISPIVNGDSIKGPTAKLMREMNLNCNVKTIAEIYKDIATTIVIDKQDEAEANEISSMGFDVMLENIVMANDEDKKNLAKAVIDFSGNL